MAHMHGSSPNEVPYQYIPMLLMMMMMNTVIFHDGHIGIFSLEDLSFLYNGI